MDFNVDKFLEDLFAEQRWKTTWKNSDQLAERMHDVAASLNPDATDMALAWAKLGLIVAGNLKVSESIVEDAAFLKRIIDGLAQHPRGDTPI